MLLTKELIGADKLVRYKRDECEIFIIEKEGENYIMAVYNGRETVYAKVAPAFARWDCTNILYYPFGYFVFAESEEKLIEKIKLKLEELKRNVIG